MGIDVVGLGKHKAVFKNPDEIIEIITNISKKTDLKQYALNIKEYYKDLIVPERNEDLFIKPYLIDRYAKIEEQYYDQDCISFHGFKDCGIGGLHIFPDKLEFYPGFRWLLFAGNNIIHDAVVDFAKFFFSQLGCEEIIFIPDGPDISSKLLCGAIERSDEVKYCYELDSIMADMLNSRKFTYDEFKYYLEERMGLPAKNQKEFSSNKYRYFLVKF
ncbi:MAG: hypothetical protein PHS40_10650 [Mariniphaga sp.]|nr:hypothetical protein [Mariniphaga sp.]